MVRVRMGLFVDSGCWSWKSFWDVSVERLGGDRPQNTMHTMVEPGLLALIWVFSSMLLPQLPDPLLLASGQDQQGWQQEEASL